MIISYRKFLVACANRVLNATAVVNKAGCSKMVLHRIKQGKNLNAATAGKLAVALGVPVESLLVDEQ